MQAHWPRPSLHTMTRLPAKDLPHLHKNASHNGLRANKANTHIRLSCLCYRPVSVQIKEMPAKKHKKDPALLEGTALIKEVNRRIRLARRHWDAHNNAATRRERTRALELYQKLSPAERTRIPQALRVWLRYRSEKYFGE
jgi:hypothetical protein